MVKMNELRDGCGLQPMALFGRPAQTFGKFRLVLPMAANYPEVINRFVIFNASPSWIRGMEMFKSLAYRWFKTWFKDDYSDDAFARDDAKLQMVRIGDWEGMGTFMNARGIQIWADSVTAASDEVAPGCMAVRALWLRHGATCPWSLASEDSTPLEALFFPSEGGFQRLAKTKDHASGHFRAEGEGCLLLVADNTSSWRRKKRAQLRLMDPLA